jgi:two-component system KDP operon response regulator KdpE
MKEEGRKVILCIDDDESNRQLMTKLLGRRRPGDVVVCVGSGEAGLERAAIQAPNLVLLDLTLPDMSGDEVLRRFKQQYDAAVIVISGHADQATKNRLISSGADSYLAKPIDAAELLSLVGALLDG